MPAGFIDFLLLVSGAAFAHSLRSLQEVNESGVPKKSVGVAWIGFALIGIAYLAWRGGGARGFFSSLPFLSVGAMSYLAFHAEIRKSSSHSRKDINQKVRLKVTRRGLYEFLLAGPVGAFASLACGAVISAHIPVNIHMRFIYGGLSVPIIWSLMIMWVTSSMKLLRTALLLVAMGGLAGYIASLEMAFNVAR